MPRPALIQQITDGLMIERSVVSEPFDFTPSQTEELDALSRDFIRLDKTVTAFETMREQKRQEILDFFGPKAEHVVGIRHRHSSGKWRTIRVWLNRFSYDIGLLYEKLKKRLDIFKSSVREGQAFRVVIAASPSTRDGVIAEFEKATKAKFEHCEITPYRYSDLEEMVDEPLLIELCKKGKINLSGTRQPVFNFRVYND